MRDHIDLTHAAIHALNEWMYETWTFNYEDRIFATPVITLPIVEKAIEELEWVRRTGRQDRPHPPGAGSGPPRLAFVRVPRVRPLLEGRGGRRHPRVDALLGQRLHPVPERLDRAERDAAFPARLVPVHDRRTPCRSRTRWPRSSATACSPAFPSSGSLPSRPAGSGSAPSSSISATPTRRCRTPSRATRSSSSRRNVYVSPFHEDDLGEIIDVIGADHVLFGSDWPHPEGLAEPRSYADHLPAGLPARRRRQDHGGQPGPHHEGRRAGRRGVVGRTPRCASEAETEPGAAPDRGAEIPVQNQIPGRARVAGRR